MAKKVKLESWVKEKICCPVSKTQLNFDELDLVDGVFDARIFLSNTYGFAEWLNGQEFFEGWEVGGVGYQSVSDYVSEIEGDAEVYDFFPLKGDILDVGGLSGTLREFLTSGNRYLCVDPYLKAPFTIPENKKRAYKCLNEPYNFVGAMAEFLPIKSSSFDVVHMRSMLDHVQVPDLALIEAHRVLKPNGSLIIGMTVDGGKNGEYMFIDMMKDKLKSVLAAFGFSKYRDHHTWHPTYEKLIKLASDNGFELNGEFWQPKWKNRVVFLKFYKARNLL